MSTLIVQTSFLGDMVLTTPLIAHVAQGDDVDVICTPAAGALLANNPDVRSVIRYDKRGSDRGIVGFVKLATHLWRNRYDRALLAQGSSRSGALAIAAGIQRRIGFDTSAGRGFYTERIPYIENEHHALRLLRLAGATGDIAPRPRLFPGEAERRAVDALLGDGGSGDMVALAPGSVWATKRWPEYAQLAAALARRSMRIVVIGSAADSELAKAICSSAPGQVIDTTGKLSLLASAELIGRCRALVTNDSAPQHLASAMNTPTLTIFGPTVPAFGFGPLADRSATVGIDTLACRPCDKHGPVACPLGHWKCMREVAVDQVEAVVMKLTS